MNKKNIAIALGLAGVLGAAGYGLYWIGMQQGMKTGSAHAPATASQASGRKILYWHDPMVPGQKFDKPGKSPYMDMPLQPVYADGAADEGAVAISSSVQQNLGIRTAEVTRRAIAPAVMASGSVAYNERDVALVQARGNGFVERLFVRAPFDTVRKGQPLAELYVPEWVAAQEEYLTARQMHLPGSDLAGAARQRMRLAGMTDDQVAAVVSTGKVHPRLTVRSPVDGVIGELSVRQGMTVTSGAPLFRINGLATVWINAEVPEALSAQLRPGSLVEVTTPALPGKVLTGKLSAILPEVSVDTRTLQVRIELANPGRQLVPGMFASVKFTPAAHGEVLTVPSEAVIQTGKRSIVMLAMGGGKFKPVDVTTGAEANGDTEIRSGLQAGQKVVVSGQFLVDSEASLRGTVNRLGESPAGQPAVHRGAGRLEKIGKDEMTFSHGPIATLGWPAMTMSFKVGPRVQPGNIAVGDTATFELRETADGEYEIISIAAGGTRPGAAKHEGAH
ncbi:MAG TPA: efflux RND transporter periplasmic adaptor subunit [Telluria sp.]|nr:efflux RND transporter periplasmic adaptor subunit [Telluria sp.]